MPKVSKKWRSLLGLIPGYCPFATAEEGQWFDDKAAQLALDFWPSCLTLFEGVEEQPFELQPWQAAIVANLYGWKREDGRRRYTTLWLGVSRKNGKSPLSAGILAYEGFVRREPGGQLYSCSSDRASASLVFRWLAGFIERDPDLASRSRIHRSFKSIDLPNSGIYRALASGANRLHGLNTSCLVADEVHTYPNRDLLDALTTSMASRSEPLTVYTTTADFAGRPSVCNELHDYALAVRDGTIADSAFLPAIWEAPEGCALDDEAAWLAANPNLGVSVSREFLRAEAEKAKRIPSRESSFRRFHLNQRVGGGADKWLRVEDWAACHAEWVPDGPCWGGLDLSTTTDVSAFVLAFLDGETIRLVPHFWIPERKLKDSDRVPYELWAQQGHLTVTPGDVTDYAIIRRDLLAIAERYDLQHVRYDPWNASHLVNELQGDGLQMVQHRQGFASMSGPSKEFERRIIGRTLSHDGNPVLSWMVGNAALAEDAAGNIKPDKKRSSERIDGVTASIMAVAGALTGEASSIYNERGILTL